jgi:hypothetical protein
MQQKYLEYIKTAYRKFLKAYNAFLYMIIITSALGLGVNFVFAQATNTPEQITAGSSLESQGGLMNPNKSEAGIWDIIKTVNTTISLMCDVGLISASGECEKERGPWFRSLILRDGIADTIGIGLCGQIFDTWIEKAKQDPYTSCGDPTKAVAYTPQVGQFVLYPYGGAGILASTFDYAQKEATPPTDLALFINDTTKDNILGTQPAYAQSVFEGDFRLFVLRAWRLTRNIALGLMGVVVGISALMIMFRAQIAPRVSVSVYNVLPMIPIGLGLILLSYPIITLVLSLMWPLQSFASNIGWELVRESFLPGTPLAAANLAGGGLLIMSIGLIVSGIVSSGIGSLIMIIIALIILGMVFYAIIKSAWTYVTIYISMMFTTIVSPLIILLSVLPGRSGLIMNLGKRLLVDLLSIPVMFFVFLLGLGVLAYSPGFYTGWSSGVTSMPAPATGSGGFFFLIAYIMKYFIGIGIMLKVKDVRKSLEGMIGVGSLWGMGGDEKRR